MVPFPSSPLSLGFSTPVTLQTHHLVRAPLLCRSPSRHTTACPAMTLREPQASSSPSSSPDSTFDLQDAVRPELKTMAAYTPIVPYDVLATRLGRDPSQIVKLDANENPYGPAPSVRAALADSPYLHIYPDPESTALRNALSDYTSLDPAYLLAGAGADELIDLLFRLFITPGAGDCVINCPPTFGMYKFDADVNGATVVNIPRHPDFSLDIEKIEAAFAPGASNTPPKMIFIASPNNPDGSSISDTDLNRLLALPTLVVLDEAYFEFGPHNRITWVPQRKNLAVLRTFSKWAGLAGMRIGYGAFPLYIMEHLWKIKQPYNVSVAAQAAGIASIREKEDLLSKVERMIAQRDRFYQEVARFDWLTPFPSESNYVLCRVSGGRTASDMKKALMDEGILIRYYSSAGLSDCIRISMGTEEQMESLYKVLETL